MTPISADQLRKIMPAAGYHASVYAGPLDAAMVRFSIDTPKRAPKFLAQVARESAQLICVEESLNYSAAGLMGEWPGHFDLQTAAAYAHQPQKIANRAYASRMGNGDEASGDGWKYRGRCLLQITGKDGYKACGEALGLDLVTNPDLLLQPDNAALAAAWYWCSRGLNALADTGAFNEITHRITGSFNDVQVRNDFLVVALKTLAVNLEAGEKF
jgi:putative chitinase